MIEDMRIRQIVKSWLKDLRQIYEQKPFQVQFYNVWDGQAHDDYYWYQFIKSKALLNSNKKVAFFSCFGDRSLIDKVKADVKIFLSGENLRDSHYAAYADNCLGNNNIDLSLGFDVFEHPRYIRFPIWMDYMFAPTSTVADIRRRCTELRFPNINDNRKFCCMVASHGADGLRQMMMDAISKISPVDSAGAYLHNDDSLVEVYSDDKKAYLKNYNFNICPENAVAYGYTTEKLFEAITAGCIPIYHGAEFADKEVINSEAIILWNRESCGKTITQIEELYSNPALLKEFMRQPRLKDTAEEYILDTFSTIENRLRTLLG